jgi:DNA-binding MarR family transcriptional regulator
MAPDHLRPGRVTLPTLTVLAALLEDPQRDWFGLEISRHTRLGSSTVSQALFRLEQWGWVVSFWEDRGEATEQGRPRRRFYHLTEHGRREATILLQERVAALARVLPALG